MRPPVCLLAAALAVSGPLPARSQEPLPAPHPADGVYAVQRDGLQEKEVLPLRDGEVLLTHRHRYLTKDAKEPPRFLVVRCCPEVALDLAAAPQAVKDGPEVVRVLLKLRPRSALALERLTGDHRGKELVIVVGGEVVTTHTVRAVIRGGEVQITSCAAGAAGYLLDRLQQHYRKK
jgi:hypothetical protein